MTLRQTAELNGELHIAGSLPSVFDGNSVSFKAAPISAWGGVWGMGGSRIRARA